VNKNTTTIEEHDNENAKGQSAVSTATPVPTPSCHPVRKGNTPCGGAEPGGEGIFNF